MLILLLSPAKMLGHVLKAELNTSRETEKSLLYQIISHLIFSHGSEVKSSLTEQFFTPWESMKL